MRMHEKFCYCPRCGHMGFSLSTEAEQCSICSRRGMREAPPEFQLTRENYLHNNQQFMQNRQRLIDEVIRKSFIFDADLYDRKDEIREENSRRMQEILARVEGRDQGNAYGIECPYCHATNVTRISATKRMTSTWLFGAGSGTLGKQWHCTRCNSDF